MVSLAEIETAVSTLSPDDKLALFRRLADQLARVQLSGNSQGSHSVLEIPTVQLGPILRPWSEMEDDDLLEEMLET